jgi:hypothetical protein
MFCINPYIVSTYIVFEIGIVNVRVYWDVNVKSPIVLFSQGVSTSVFKQLIPKSSEDF